MRALQRHQGIIVAGVEDFISTWYLQTAYYRGTIVKKIEDRCTTTNNQHSGFVLELIVPRTVQHPGGTVIAD